MKRVSSVLFATALVAATAVTTSAGVITDVTAAFSAGIDPLGALYDGGIGLERNSDGLDVIKPGTPRDSWGVSAGSTGGYANHEYWGVSNIVANGAPVFGANSAYISTYLNAGPGNLLRVDQTYTFGAPNVLAIEHRISNVTGSAKTVKYARNVDWDIAPSPFSETITVDALPSFVSDATWFGFENPNPLIGYGGQSSGPGGGTFGPGDNGAGFQLGIGSLGAGSQVGFTVFHALTSSGQSEAALRSQLYGLGAGFVITGKNSGSYVNGAGLGVTGLRDVPEPSTLGLLTLLGGIGLAARCRRRFLS